jgi:3-methyladenine DNA glycosylase AlkD
MPNKFKSEIEKYLLDLSKFLKDNSNRERAEKEKAYLYSDLKHYGVSSPVGHNFFLMHKKFLTSLSKSEAIKLTTHLWSQPSFEERTSALGVLGQHLAQLDHTDMPLIEKLMRESKGWALLDSLIIPFMPTILQKSPKTYAYLEKWIKDSDYWVRRSALLAQLLFFRQGKGGKPDLFFKFAKSQFDESWIDENYKNTLQRSRARFFIRKAIGWTLREMSAKNPEVVVEFLNENKSKMSGLSYREGSRKLPPKYVKLLCTS